MTNIYYSPNYIKKYNIYDIFYNDINQLIIIIPAEKDPFIIKYCLPNDNSLNFNICKVPVNSCKNGHIYIYSLEIEYSENIRLNINNDIIETYVNKYPILTNEIILSTMVKYDDNIIKQWIDFHLKLGFTKIVIYDNKNSPDMEIVSFNRDPKRNIIKESILEILLKDYITNNSVILIKWDYSKYLEISNISGQIAQQNHSIYAFNTAKYIGLFDVDEYINIQEKLNIDDFLNNYIFNNNININTISSFRLLNKFFYNPENKQIIDNNFLYIFNCDNITKQGHEKNIVIPKNVKMYYIHRVFLPRDNMITIDDKLIFFNHYYYLNKHNRGRNNTTIIDKSIIKHL